MAAWQPSTPVSNAANNSAVTARSSSVPRLHTDSSSNSAKIKELSQSIHTLGAMLSQEQQSAQKDAKTSNEQKQAIQSVHEQLQAMTIRLQQVAKDKDRILQTPSKPSMPSANGSGISNRPASASRAATTSAAAAPASMSAATQAKAYTTISSSATMGSRPGVGSYSHSTPTASTAAKVGSYHSTAAFTTELLCLSQKLKQGTSQATAQPQSAMSTYTRTGAGMQAGTTQVRPVTSVTATATASSAALPYTPATSSGLQGLPTHRSSASGAGTSGLDSVQTAAFSNIQTQLDVGYTKSLQKQLRELELRMATTMGRTGAAAVGAGLQSVTRLADEIARTGQVPLSLQKQPHDKWDSSSKMHIGASSNALPFAPTSATNGFAPQNNVSTGASTLNHGSTLQNGTSTAFSNSAYGLTLQNSMSAGASNPISVPLTGRSSFLDRLAQQAGSSALVGQVNSASLSAQSSSATAASSQPTSSAALGIRQQAASQTTGEPSTIAGHPASSTLLRPAGLVQQAVLPPQPVLAAEGSKPPFTARSRTASDSGEAAQAVPMANLLSDLMRHQPAVGLSQQVHALSEQLAKSREEDANLKRQYMKVFETQKPSGSLLQLADETSTGIAGSNMPVATPAVLPPPCSKCADTQAQLSQALAQVTERSTEVSELRVKLQEAREVESKLQAELAVVQETSGVQDRQLRQRLSLLESELRSLYQAALQRSAAGLPDLETICDALRKRVQSLVADQQTQAAEVGRLQAELQQAHVEATRREQLSSMAISEADRARAAVEQQAAQAAQKATQDLAAVRASHEAQVTSLHKQIRQLEEDMQQMQKEHDAREGQLKEYGRTLEDRLVKAKEHAGTAAESAQEAGMLRKQVTLFRSQIEELASVRAQLDNAQDEGQALEKRLSCSSSHVEELRAELATAQHMVTEQARLAAERQEQLHTVYADLKETVKKLELSQTRQQHQKEQWDACVKELHAIHTEHQTLQQQHAALRAQHQALQAQLQTCGIDHSLIGHSSGGTVTHPLTPKLRQHNSPRMAEPSSDTSSQQNDDTLLGHASRHLAKHSTDNTHDSAHEADAPVSMFNDGTMEGLKHENRVLKARVADQQATIVSWDSRRYADEQALKQQLEAAQECIQQLEQQLAAATSQQDMMRATLAQLSADVAHHQEEAKLQGDRASVAERSVLEQHHVQHSLEVVSQQRQDLQQLLDAAKEELRTVKSELDKRLTESQAEQLRAQLRDTTNMLTTELHETRQRLQAQLSQTQQQLTSQLQDVEAQLAIRTQEVSMLRAAADEYEDAIRTLDAEMGAMQARLNESEAARAQLELANQQLQSSHEHLLQQLQHVDGPEGPTARARQLEAALQQERLLHQALKAQMPALLAQLDQARSDLAAKESEALRLDGTVNILRNEVLRLQQGGF